jgi:hypothetical protein
MMIRNPRLIENHLTLFITMSGTFSRLVGLLGLLGLAGSGKECFTDNISNTSSTGKENSIKSITVIDIE